MNIIILESICWATIETIYMVVIASFISIAIGMHIALILYFTRNKKSKLYLLNRAISYLVNVVRSIPFVILVIMLLPVIRYIIGTTIGVNAASFALAICAVPFFTRIAEAALYEISQGMIESGIAMGVTKRQLIYSILLPEASTNLIRGATITIINLIGYSTIVGIMGGGGLGELAINYGYYHLDLYVLLLSVLVLIILVQLTQWIGDKLAVMRRKFNNLFLFIIISVSLPLWAIKNYSNDNEVLRIGVMKGPQEAILLKVKEVAEKNYNLKIDVVTFEDYILPNEALNNGSIDVNIFQHQPYLDEQIKRHKYGIQSIAKTYIYPLGFYSKTWKNVNDLPNGSLIVLPNDPSNQCRALLLLRERKLITLKANINYQCNIHDVLKNERNYRFKLMSAAFIPKVMEDADLVAITNDFVLNAGLNINNAIIKENEKSAYANIVAVRSNETRATITKTLIEILHSQLIVEETIKYFPDGAAVIAWKDRL